MNPGLHLSILLALAVAGQADPGPERSAAELYAAGQEAAARGDYAAALTCFQAAEKQGYVDPLLHYELGRVYEHLGRYDEARERFNRFAEAQRSSSPRERPPVRQVLVTTVPDLQAGSRKTSPPPQPPAGTGWVLIVRDVERQGDTPEQELAPVRPSAPDLHPQYRIAQLYLKRRQFSSALEAFRQYLARVPEATNRAEVEQTIRELEQAIEGREGDGRGRRGSEGSEDSEEALPALETRKAPKLDRATARTFARHLRNAVKQAEAGDLPGAVAAFGEALSTAPDTPVKVRSPAWLTYLALGQALQGVGRLPEAQEAYQQILAHDPPPEATATAHSLLGEIHLGQQHWESAAEAFESALAADPNLAVAHLNLGRVRASQGRAEEALAAFQRAVQLAPEDPVTHFQKALALQGMDRFDEAADEYREVIRLQPSTPEPHNNLALVLKKQGKWEEAIAEYRAALQLQPDDPVTRGNLAAALFQRGPLEEAAAEYRALRERQPQAALPRCMLGRVLARQGQLEEALAELRQAVQVAPEDPLSHNTLAWFHLMAPREPYRDLAAGWEQARRAVELAPENAYCLGTLGLACYRNGDYGTSLQWTHQGLDASRDGAARALNLYLGSMAQAHLGHLDPAVKLYQVAVATDPNNEFRTEAEEVLKKATEGD